MAVRKRIGVMVPSTDTTFEADFQLVAPRDVTIHGQRLWLANDAAGEAGMDRPRAGDDGRLTPASPCATRVTAESASSPATVRLRA